MAATYKVPMHKAVLAIFLIVVVALATVVTWSFRSGLMWTAICLIAVAGPLALFYWYMLYVTPKRASITVADEGILLAAPPFSSAVIPWAAVEKVFDGNLHTDETLKIGKTTKYMNFAGYHSGVVELVGGQEAVVVSNRRDVLCIQTGERIYMLGPSDLEGFKAEVKRVGP